MNRPEVGLMNRHTLAGKAVERFGRGTGQNLSAGGRHREDQRRISRGQRKTLQAGVLRGEKFGFPEGRRCG